MLGPVATAVLLAGLGRHEQPGGTQGDDEHDDKDGGAPPVGAAEMVVVGT